MAEREKPYHEEAPEPRSPVEEYLLDELERLGARVRSLEQAVEAARLREDLLG